MSVFEVWSSNCVSTDVNSEMRGKAKEFFQALCGTHRENKGNGDIKICQSSISNNLATLISKMEEPLSSNLNLPKLKALSCMLGALEGIDKNIGIPIKMVELMSKFFLEYCGPMHPTEISIEDSSNIETCSVDEVRDSALACVNSLIQVRMLTEDLNLDKDASIQLRLSIMKEGIQRRCSSYEDEEEDVEDYYDDHMALQNEHARILSNLSLLPRSKRSLCFNILAAALKGIGVDNEPQASQYASSLDDKTIHGIIVYVEFACSCLHGESDPRCLMQMLLLLKDIQSIVLPILYDVVEDDLNGKYVARASFPFTSIFDAVAPYYPIKFTPPPNDPFGITKEELHRSLLDVFTYSTHHIIKDEGKRNALLGHNHMTNLATNLFLERLHIDENYYDEDEELTTVLDRIDALEDLNDLLLPITYFDLSNSTQELSIQKPYNQSFTFLSSNTLQEISNTLCRCHQNAAISVVSATNAEDKKNNKNLADTCRSFANRISYELEMQLSIYKLKQTGEKSAWENFVLHIVHHLLDVISTSPQSVKGRVSLAYAASLAACGGEKTLRLCLDSYLPLLLGFLKQFESLNNDEEQISTAAYGIGVFFSSSKLSMEQISKSNVVIHPHPLKIFVSEIVQLFCKIISHNEASHELKVAVVKALESVLISSPHNIMDDQDIEVIKRTILHISNSVIDSLDRNSKDKLADSDWSVACSRLVGTTIGKSFNQAPNDGVKEREIYIETIFEANRDISTFVQDIVLPKLLETCVKIYGDIKSNIRIDWKIIAYACEMGNVCVSNEILIYLFGALNDAIQSLDDAQVQHVLFAISNVFQHGGINPSVTFHAQDLQVKLFEIFSFQNSNQQDAEMSPLLLPDVREKAQTQANKVVQLAYRILPHVLPVYSNGTPHEKILYLVSLVADVLPPLTDNDNVKLCCLLPIVSIILTGDHNLHESILYPLLSPLIEFCLASENDECARRSAASCISSIISHSIHDDNIVLIENILSELAAKFLSHIRQIDHDEKLNTSELRDILNLISLVGSATLSRGGTLSRFGDAVATFLAAIACKVDIPKTSFASIVSSDAIDWRHIPTKIEFTLSLTAGHALGSMLTVSNGNPFWKQRLSQKILTVIHPIENRRSTKIEYGRLSCVSYLVLCVPVRALGEKKYMELCNVIFNGLDVCNDFSIQEKTTDEVQSLKKLLITSLLKVIEVSHVFSKYGELIISMTLLTLFSADEREEIPLQLTALQVLMNITKMMTLNYAGPHLYRSEYKVLILKHLARLLDHPSLQIRQAAATVRNAWFVINYN